MSISERLKALNPFAKKTTEEPDAEETDDMSELPQPLPEPIAETPSEVVAPPPLPAPEPVAAAPVIASEPDAEPVPAPVAAQIPAELAVPEPMPAPVVEPDAADVETIAELVAPPEAVVADAPAAPQSLAEKAALIRELTKGLSKGQEAAAFAAEQGKRAAVEALLVQTQDAFRQGSEEKAAYAALAKQLQKEMAAAHVELDATIDYLHQIA